MEHSWDISEVLAKTYLHNYPKNSKNIVVNHYSPGNARIANIKSAKMAD